MHPHCQVTFLPRAHRCVLSGLVSCTRWDRRDKWGGPGWEGVYFGWRLVAPQGSDIRPQDQPSLCPAFLWGEVGVPCPRSGDHRGAATCGHLQ